MEKSWFFPGKQGHTAVCFSRAPEEALASNWLVLVNAFRIPWRWRSVRLVCFSLLLVSCSFFFVFFLLAASYWTVLGLCPASWAGVEWHGRCLHCHREAFGLVWWFTAWLLVAGGCCGSYCCEPCWPLFWLGCAAAAVPCVGVCVCVFTLFSVVGFDRLLILQHTPARIQHVPHA